MEEVKCNRCGTVNEFHVVESGPHLKAICDHCNRYIKFISRNLKPQAAVPPTSIMSDLLYGSICIEDAFGQHITQSQDGRKWIPLDVLSTGAFQVGKNGKHYLNINVWVNDQVDQYGNQASLSISQTKEQREAKEKRVYIGNLKRNTPNGTAQPQPQGYPAQPQPYAAAPQQPYAPGGAYPTAAPQGNPYAQPQGNPYAPQPTLQHNAPGAWNPNEPAPF
jgi:hypothetical protein